MSYARFFDAIVKVPTEIAANQRAHDGVQFSATLDSGDAVAVKLAGHAYGLHTPGTGDMVVVPAEWQRIADVIGEDAAERLADEMPPVDDTDDLYLGKDAGASCQDGAEHRWPVYAVASDQPIAWLWDTAAGYTWADAETLA